MQPSPAFAFADKLEAKGLKLKRIFYHPDDFSKSALLDELGSLNLFASTSRQRLSKEEVELANDIARASPTFMHVALWNPYSALDVAKPAILSFGFIDAKLNRTIEILFGAEAEGSPPFELAT